MLRNRRFLAFVHWLLSQWYVSDTSTLEDALKMLQPYNAKEMKAYEIGTAVNSVQNESSKVIEPLAKTGLGAFI